MNKTWLIREWEVLQLKVLAMSSSFALHAKPGT